MFIHRRSTPPIADSAPEREHEGNIFFRFSREFCSCGSLQSNGTRFSLFAFSNCHKSNGCRLLSQCGLDYSRKHAVPKFPSFLSWSTRHSDRCVLISKVWCGKCFGSRALGLALICRHRERPCSRGSALAPRGLFLKEMNWSLNMVGFMQSRIWLALWPAGGVGGGGCKLATPRPPEI